MVEAWSDFARTGNPNGRGDRPWPTYNPKVNKVSLMSLNIPSSTLISDDQFKAQHKCGFWDSVLTYVAPAPR